MLTIETISDKVNLAKAFYLEQLATIYIKMKSGCGNTHKIQSLKRLIHALTFDIQSETVDNITITNYNCLMKLLQGFSGAYVPDPNVVIPGQTIITVGVISGYNINKYAFTTTDDNPNLVFSNYHTNYYPLYGNSKTLGLALYITGDTYQGDEQTSPIIEFTDPNNTNSDIVSITYEFPIGTTGEVQMWGLSPIQSGSSSGGSGAVPIVMEFSQSNLLEDGVGSGNWYLPLMLTTQQVPISASINGVSIELALNQNFSPVRLYGFANNTATQVIKVTVI